MFQQADFLNASFTRRQRRGAARERAGIQVLLVEFAAWRPRLASLVGCLDRGQRQRVERLRDPAHRRDRQLAYALHRVALGEHLQLPAACVPLFRSSLGQPRLENDLVHTSLSHGNTHAAIAISAAGPVGVDIESRERTFPLSPLADRICHAEENGLMSDGDLLRLWVRKEALLKAIGIGLGLEMTSFQAPENGVVTLRSDPSAPTTTLRVQHVDAGAQCTAAVAGPPDATVECHWLLPDAGCAFVSTHLTHAGSPSLPMPSYPH